MTPPCFSVPHKITAAATEAPAPCLLLVACEPEHAATLLTAVDRPDLPCSFHFSSLPLLHPLTSPSACHREPPPPWISPPTGAAGAEPSPSSSTPPSRSARCRTLLPFLDVPAPSSAAAASIPSRRPRLPLQRAAGAPLIVVDCSRTWTPAPWAAFGCQGPARSRSGRPPPSRRCLQPSSLLEFALPLLCFCFCFLSRRGRASSASNGAAPTLVAPSLAAAQ